MTFKAYKEYENTGVEWLGKLPAHWDVVPLKAGFNLMKRPPPEDCGVVTAFRDGEVTLRSNRRMDGFTEAFQEIGYQGVEPNDLVIHAMDAFAGAIGVSDSKGKSTPVYSVCEPKKDYFSRYYGLVLRHISLAGFIQSLAKGIRERSTDFRWSDAKNISVPHPSVDEQKTIINFIDYETAKIDTLIAEQERLGELLKEKRQVVISKAVTKGLNPNAKLKESRIEWLGDIPESWKVIKLKKITSRISSGKTPSGGADVYVDTGVIFLRSQNVYDEGLQLEHVVRIPEKIDAEMSSSRVKGGDILLNITGGSIGRSCCLPYDFEPANVNQHVCAIRLTNPDMVSFVELFFKSDIIKKQIDYIQNGAAREGLNFEQIGNFSICIPPLDERNLLVEEVRRKIKNFNDLTSQIIELIALLEERRSALISAAVCGQIDVRTTNGN